MSVKAPTTWKRDGVVHEVEAVSRTGPTFLDKTQIAFRTTCGLYERVDDDRAFVFERLVDCIECLAPPSLPLKEWNFSSMKKE